MKKTRKSNKIPTVVLDLDDTLVDFMGGLLLFHNKRFNTCVATSDLKSWDWCNIDMTDVLGNTVTGKDLKSTFEDYEQHGLYAALNVLGDADLALELIKKLGYKVIILTAREDKYGKQTEINLAFNGLARYIDEIYFLPNKPTSEAKVSKLQELAKTHHFALFADDRASTVNKVAQCCSVDNCFVIEQEHNKNEELDEDVRRVHDLMSTVRYLKAYKA